MGKWTSLALLAAGLAAVTAAAAFALGAFRRPPGKTPDPVFATPRSTLDEYIRAVLAVDEDAELATAAPELRAQSERQRGKDKAQRRENLKGKAAMFREMPIKVVSEKIWGDNAKILVTQGGPADNPIHYVYTFRLIDGEWKVTQLELTRDLRW